MLKTGSPLTNPLPGPGINRDNNVSGAIDTRGKGDSKGGTGRTIVAESVVKCPQCGRETFVCFPIGRPPEWIKCSWCQQLQPEAGYRCTSYGKEIPRPVTPADHEMRKLAREAGR